MSDRDIGELRLLLEEKSYGLRSTYLPTRLEEEANAVLRFTLNYDSIDHSGEIVYLRRVSTEELLERRMLADSGRIELYGGGNYSTNIDGDTFALFLSISLDEFFVGGAILNVSFYFMGEKSDSFDDVIAITWGEEYQIEAGNLRLVFLWEEVGQP